MPTACSSVLTGHVQLFFLSNTAIWPRYRLLNFFSNLPRAKAGEASKRGISETNGAGAVEVKASQRTRETTQVALVAQEGKSRAKTGRNTQTNNTSDHQAGKSR